MGSQYKINKPAAIASIRKVALDNKWTLSGSSEMMLSRENTNYKFTVVVTSDVTITKKFLNTGQKEITVFTELAALREMLPLILA